MFQDRNINILAGTTVENKGKLILIEIFPSVQKHDFFSIDIHPTFKVSIYLIPNYQKYRSSIV